MFFVDNQCLTRHNTHAAELTAEKRKVSVKDETKNQSGSGALQREAKSSRLETLRKKRISIREGHVTGGYCDTEALLEVEKEIFGVLSKDLEAAKEKHGYSPDPKFKHAEVRAIELELNGLAFRPRLVVAES